MFRVSLRTAFLGTGLLLFLMALTFAWTREPFHVETTSTGVAVAANTGAACGVLGFAIAGGLALVAAAIVDHGRHTRVK
jgi:hypothetical protein